MVSTINGAPDSSGFGTSYCASCSPAAVASITVDGVSEPVSVDATAGWDLTAGELDLDPSTAATGNATATVSLTLQDGTVCSGTANLPGGLYAGAIAPGIGAVPATAASTYGCTGWSPTGGCNGIALSNLTNSGISNIVLTSVYQTASTRAGPWTTSAEAPLNLPAPDANCPLNTAFTLAAGQTCFVAYTGGGGSSGQAAYTLTVNGVPVVPGMAGATGAIALFMAF